MQLQGSVLEGQCRPGNRFSCVLCLQRSASAIRLQQSRPPWALNPNWYHGEIRLQRRQLRAVAGGAGRQGVIHSRNGRGLLASDTGLHMGPWRRMRSGVQITASMKDEQKRSDSEFQKWTLEQLDEQLKGLEDQGTEETERPSKADRERFKPTLKQLDEQLRELQIRESLAARRASGGRGDGRANDDKVFPLELPEFTTEFFVYTAIGLVLLTIINNVLYRISFGPQVDKGWRVSSSDTSTGASLLEGREDNGEEAGQSKNSPLLRD